MTIIDKYIIKKVLYTFLFVVLIITAVVIMVDASEKIDVFTKNNVPFIYILGYYRDFSFWIIGIVSPIMVFITVVFVTSQMASRTELIAIFGSGVSFSRLLFPYFIASLIIAIIHFFLNGWVIPKANRSQIEFQMEHLNKKYYFNDNDIHMQIEPDVYFYIQSYSNEMRTGYQFTLERFENNRLVDKLTANNIRWDSVKEKWSLQYWKRRSVDSLFRSDYTPPPLATTEGRYMDTTLAILPGDFRKIKREYSSLTVDELSQHIKKLHFRGASGAEAFEVEWHLRYSSPFIIFVLVFLGVVVSSKKSRGGTGFQVALGFLLSFILIIFFIMSRALAEAGSVSPLLAAWIPGLSFSIITVGVYRWIHRF